MTETREAGWRPIETNPLPIDETVIIVVEPTEKNLTFYGRSKPWTLPVYIDEARNVCCPGTWKADPSFMRGMHRATHWMPLPTPPQGGEDER